MEEIDQHRDLMKIGHTSRPGSMLDLDGKSGLGEELEARGLQEVQGWRPIAGVRAEGDTKFSHCG